MTEAPHLAQRVAEFCAASVRGWDRSAVRMLAETPEIAGYSLATALLLGDAGQALAAPVSTRDVAGVRLLLDGGVDPRRYADDDERPTSAVYAAVHAGCPAEVIALLIDHGADPAQPGPDGHTAAWLATVYGRTDLAPSLGAQADVTDTTRFAGACRRGDRATATARAAADPTLAARLTEGEQAALVHAAEAGDAAAVALILDLGFPVAARRPDDEATALHAAAYAGSAPVVRLLIERGADLAARDGQWQSTPLDWAAVGSGYRPDSAPHPDWVATVRALLEAGASTADISLDDGPKRPSPEVADLLRAHGTANHGA